MIGVIADAAEHRVVEEFFELFKTPWEFYKQGRDYEVVLCAGEYGLSDKSAKIVVIYAGQALQYDADTRVPAGTATTGGRFGYRGVRVPLYGPNVTFRKTSTRGGERVDAGGALVYIDRSDKQIIVRLGYNLFEEVQHVLEHGQPIAEAKTPTLDLHIAILRDIIVTHGAMLVEVPPVPAGYEFIACLTHDVDHPSIRAHRFDHTMFGFLYRAVIGSLTRFREGDLSWRGVLQNGAAALKLPLVHLGIAEDFWHTFDRYRSIENGLPSTFYLIPFKGRAGRVGAAPAPQYRASGYGAADLSVKIQELTEAGCEVALHGIDAWRDSSRGLEELREVQRITGSRDAGVRMHWLYFDDASPEVLDETGFDYDSTYGYNETIGYRAGTAQAYRPLRARRLLELPLHVMDTALFYPRHLGLKLAEARKRIQTIVHQTTCLGGCVTVNWHDRSIAPERLWGDVYADLIDDFRSNRAWFATASQAAAWFRKRRSVVFGDGDWQARYLGANASSERHDGLPPLQVRIHNAPAPPSGATVSAIRQDAVIGSF